MVDRDLRVLLETADDEITSQKADYSIAVIGPDGVKVYSTKSDVGDELVSDIVAKASGHVIKPTSDMESDGLTFQYNVEIDPATLNSKMDVIKSYLEDNDVSFDEVNEPMFDEPIVDEEFEEGEGEEPEDLDEATKKHKRHKKHPEKVGDPKTSAQLPTWRRKVNVGTHETKPQVGMALHKEKGLKSDTVAARVKKGHPKAERF
jgi:hypothetical protein